jgi:hypothetical protein
MQDFTVMGSPKDFGLYSTNRSFFNFNYNNNFCLARNDRIATTTSAIKVIGAKNAMNN